jgi:hypothetical protein
MARSIPDYYTANNNRSELQGKYINLTGIADDGRIKR